MDATLLSGSILLNLDTEDDDELSVGCAGGIDTNTSYAYEQVELAADYTCLEIQISGLLGGHSGMDIDKGRGNANKWLARLLWELQESQNFQLLRFDGGSLRNAIPREASALISTKDPIGTVSLLNIFQRHLKPNTRSSNLILKFKAIR